jgi:tetratricopeptide (TPR) repeat protein
MNKLIRLMTLGAMVATLALPAFALKNTSSSTETQQPQGAGTAQPAGQGDEEAKNAMYKIFTDNIKTNQPLAYQTAKEYLEKYPTEDQYTAYMKKWVVAYEKAIRKPKLNQLVNDGKYAEAFALGKQILAEDPNDLLVIRQTAVAGFNLGLTGNSAGNTESANYARRTLQLLEAGKGFEEGKPLDPKIKDENIGLFNYALGYFSLKSNPTEAIGYLLKAAQTESTFKKDPQTYIWLANAYQTGPYKKLSDEFEANYRGKEETPESKAALENLNQVIDRIMDASARAIALATDPKFATVKTQLMTQLTSFYKFRHNDSDAGMQEFISSVLSKPIPPQPTLVTVPVTPTAGTGTTTPATTTPPASTTPATTNTTTAPATTTPKPPSTNQTPPPTPSTTSSKPATPVKP